MSFTKSCAPTAPVPAGWTNIRYWEYQSNFNATTVAAAAGAASIWLSKSAVDLQPFYGDCIKKAQPEPRFYGWAFPRSHWPDGYYEDKSNFHASTLIHSREWGVTAHWTMAWLGGGGHACRAVSVLLAHGNRTKVHCVHVFVWRWFLHVSELDST